MKFTLSWLKSHINTNATVNEIENCLNKISFEVEAKTDLAKIYAPFIVAYITDAHPHPNAEKLRVCTVDDGTQKMQIVCGANNARSGIKVVLAPVGTTMPNGMQIKSTQIRGVNSHGMLCSFEELGLESENDGIIELHDDTIVGQKYADILGLDDVLFDIAVTPNRGDALSVHGIARDLSAAGLGELITKQMIQAQVDTASNIMITIEDKANCSEFTGRFINLSQPCGSDDIRNILKKINAESKLTLVNISNFVMYDIGRPNHIYDADKIVGNIVIRKAAGEEFTALDGKNYILDDEITVIADDEKVLSIAGIIGGRSSMVDENTKNIFIEVAIFNPVSIALTGRKLNINSEARYRFERRVDPQNSTYAIEYLTDTIAQYFTIKVSEIITVNGDQLKFVKIVDYTSAFFEKHAGFKIDYITQRNILNALGFVIEEHIIHIPSYRWGDITLSIDIVEEVLRIYGLDKIPSQPITIYNNNVINTIQHDKICSILTSRGYDEVITWSFCDQKSISCFDDVDVLNIKNPISSELAFMRTSIIANLLKHSANNLSRDIKNTSIFEIGNVYKSSFSDYQSQVISGMRVGNRTNKTPHSNEQKFDFFDIKADLFALIQELGLNPDNLNVIKGAAKYYHPFRSATFKLGNVIICYGGEIHPRILKEFDIKANVCGFELYLDSLPKFKVKYARSHFHASPFQAVNRDFAFILSKKTQAVELIKVIKQTNKELIEDITIFDIFEGSHLGDNNKSIAVSVKLRSQMRTLNNKEIEEACSAIIKSIEAKLNAQLR